MSGWGPHVIHDEAARCQNRLRVMLGLELAVRQWPEEEGRADPGECNSDNSAFSTKNNLFR